MDNSTDWAASISFSPSKARAHQAQAKDWASVDAWLSKRYSSKRLPSFERNEETLQALLTLASLNENADEQRSYIDRVEKTALSSLTKRSANVDKTYRLILNQPDNLSELKALAETSVVLDSPAVDGPSMAGAIIDLTSQKFDLDQQLQHINYQLNALKSEQRKLSQQLAELQSDAFQPPPDLVEQTSEWLKGTKHLKAKLAEYEERISTLRSANSVGQTVRLEDVVQQTADLEVQSARLNELETELEAFQSLPTDAKAARKKVEKAREELLRLTRERERLFEGLAGG